MNSARKPAARTALRRQSRWPAAEQQQGGGAVQHRLQMRIIRGERIPGINPEDLGEGRKQQIEVELGGGGRHQPGKADHPRQHDDAHRQLGRVDGVGNDIVRGIAERQPERQRSRIEPGQIGEIHRPHSRQHAVGTEIEHLAEMQDRLDIPFRPFAVDRRIESERHAMHADDHRGRERAPGQKIGQGAERGLGQRGIRLGQWRAHRVYVLCARYGVDRVRPSTLEPETRSPSWRMEQGKQGRDMEATQEPTSPAVDSGLGPIGLFLIKTVIVSVGHRGVGMDHARRSG